MRFTNHVKVPFKKASEDSWIPAYPNPADFRFNYHKLLEVSNGAIAKHPPGEPKRVCVIGAGAAGATVANQLVQAGCEVVLLEASERVGGRLYTIPNPDTAEADFEMGAMRMPLFGAAQFDTTQQQNEQNSVLGYYLITEPGEGHKVDYARFPNPGHAVGGTGIYINGGKGVDGRDEPKLIDWPNKGVIADAKIQGVSDKVGRAVTAVANLFKELYVQNNGLFDNLWTKVIKHYDDLTFGDMVSLDSPVNASGDLIDKERILETGNFGGFGMSDEEAEILYTIGTGDGSWGAFYDISALWFIRCTYFGFGGADLITVKGYNDKEALPEHNTYPVKTYEDGTIVRLPKVTYRGIQSLVEYLLYGPAPEFSGSSAKNVFRQDNFQILNNAKVTEIKKYQQQNAVQVTYLRDGEETTKEFSDVFITCTKWAAQNSIKFTDFDLDDLPLTHTRGGHVQHNISSCKVFVQLKRRYWNDADKGIPQILVTDTILQDVYGLTWGDNDKGILLASYTWEDDSLKLLPYDEDALKNLILDELERVVSETTGQSIKQYIDEGAGSTQIQWITEENYVGCSKLYRKGNWKYNYADLSYNEVNAGSSHLYFCGENYGVEGGWTEPALRSALDAVMRFYENNGFELKEGTGFTYNDYPSYVNQT